MENGYIENFNGRLRDECLNVEVFFSLADARHKLGWGVKTTTTIGRTRHWRIERQQSLQRQPAVEMTRTASAWKTLRVSHYWNGPPPSQGCELFW